MWELGVQISCLFSMFSCLQIKKQWKTQDIPEIPEVDFQKPMENPRDSWDSWDLRCECIIPSHPLPYDTHQAFKSHESQEYLVFSIVFLINLRNLRDLWCFSLFFYLTRRKHWNNTRDLYPKRPHPLTSTSPRLQWYSTLIRNWWKSSKMTPSPPVYIP